MQQQALRQAAATQENMARQADDPLEQYRARRRAELLELEARVVKNEQTLAAGTHPALEEQRALADRAEADFEQIKHLLADGDVSRLDALRLNNDFRRIGPERDRILRNELTSIETQLQYYENILTSVELELIEDSMADQVEHDAVLEQTCAAAAQPGEKRLRRTGTQQEGYAVTAEGCLEQAGRPHLGDAGTNYSATERAR